ncbi:hypothetical protein JCM10207_004006 [Rhodosporidiobolus poonsookiae]
MLSTLLLPLFLLSLFPPTLAQFSSTDPACIRTCYQTCLSLLNNGAYGDLAPGDVGARCESESFMDGMTGCWNASCTDDELTSGMDKWRKQCAYAISTASQYSSVWSSFSEKVAASPTVAVMAMEADATSTAHATATALAAYAAPNSDSTTSTGTSAGVGRLASLVVAYNMLTALVLAAGIACFA